VHTRLRFLIASRFAARRRTADTFKGSERGPAASGALLLRQGADATVNASPRVFPPAKTCSLWFAHISVPRSENRPHARVAPRGHVHLRLDMELLGRVAKEPAMPWRPTN
jgi:hypothetical protein